MLRFSVESIKSDIKDHIRRIGGEYTDWYVGVARDAPSQLFNHHNVQRDGGAWIIRQAYGVKAALYVESHFVHRMGAGGGPAVEESDTDFVYAFRKLPGTKP